MTRLQRTCKLFELGSMLAAVLLAGVSEIKAQELPPPPPTPPSCEVDPSGRPGGGPGGCVVRRPSVRQPIEKPASPPPQPTPQETKEQDAVNKNNLGLAAYNKGDWATANLYFRQALALQPDNPVYKYNVSLAEDSLGIAAYNNENWSVAVDHFTQAFQFASGNATLSDGIQQNLANARAELQQQQDDFARANSIKGVLTGISSEGSASGDSTGGLSFRGGPKLLLAAVSHPEEISVTTPDGQTLTGEDVASGHSIPLESRVVTGPDARMQFLLPDDTTFTMGPNGDMVMDKFVYDPSDAPGIDVRLVRGLFRFVTGRIARRRPDDLRVRLNVGDLGFRGTDAEISCVPGSEGYVKLFEGQAVITVKDTGREIVLNPGEMVILDADGTIGEPIAIEWQH